MAVRLNLSNPIFGYFITQNYVELSDYVCNLLERYNCSMVFVLHASGMFTKDAEEQELHLPTNSPLVLDPQMPEDMVRFLLEEQRGLCSDPEHFTNMQGSGWSYILNTMKYWFKVYPCQPNDGANPSRDNCNDPNNENDDNPDDPDDQMDDDQPMHPRRKFNNFLYSILEHYARQAEWKVPRTKFERATVLERFNREFTFIPEGDLELEVNMQDVAEYHAGLNKFNVRVFSLRGNLLYAKKMWPLQEEWIDLYLNSNNCFALILNLYAFFKKKHDRMFCMKCLKWATKSGNHHCEKVFTTSKQDEVMIPDIPWDRHALVAYADFESYILDKTYHRLSGWGCVIIDRDHDIYDSHYMNLISTDNLIRDFVKYISNTCIEYSSKCENDSLICQICEKDIYDFDSTISGTNFINGKSGHHHYDCWNHPKNTMYVFFHNFRGYDSHFLIKELVANVNVVHMSATSCEKFNCIQIEGWREEENRSFDLPFLRITFKDTFNFFTCSLAKCVSMIEDWRYTPEDGREDKGLFPYEWFDHKDKLMHPGLPDAPWHNVLTNTEVDPTPAFEIWNKKNFTYFYEYHDYYMMLDVIQLCDAFEEFRRTTVSEFNTDPVHFQGAPGLTWYLGVCQNPKMFKIIRDRGVYMDIQQSIRGGISQAMTRYCNVEEKPNESMFFLDVNSLYSKCMTYKMPGKFLYTATTVPADWYQRWNADSKETAILCVDLVYPEHLHDRDWAYPLAPHHFNDRLCTTFKRREQYLVHAEMLQFYLERGMVLEDVHYAYVFEQDYTLRDYVQSNIEKRRHTNSEVMKTLYKLLNNSLYGKTCENVNKYRKFEVIKDVSLERDDLSEIGSHYNEQLAEAFNMIFCGDNVLVEMPVKVAKLNKPIQIGFTILEFAKREIYRFLAAIQDHFGDRVQPLYTDTDSLLFWCDFPEPWKEFYNSPLKPFLDFEKVPEHWGVKTQDTDKQSGLWSPEAGGKEIVEYVGLRAKCYAYRFRDNTTVVKNKGVPKAAMIADEDETPREAITIEHYRKALFDGATYAISHYSIRSFKHEVITTKEYKLGISANDLKRAVTANRAISLPFGYRGETFKHLVTDADDESNLEIL
uniref:DNA-directed DNA polymerase n=1 Tax=Motacilla cinerea densovirus TaxID=2794499 RepID=A0A8A4XDY8_9VIRU|nr:MAG: PolB [Motacilla cinerea densovirus]